MIILFLSIWPFFGEEYDNTFSKLHHCNAVQVVGVVLPHPFLALRTVRRGWGWGSVMSDGLSSVINVTNICECCYSRILWERNTLSLPVMLFCRGRSKKKIEKNDEKRLQRKRQFYSKKEPHFEKSFFFRLYHPWYTLTSNNDFFFSYTYSSTKQEARVSVPTNNFEFQFKWR